MCDFCRGEQITRDGLNFKRHPESPRLMIITENEKETLFEINNCPFCGKSYKNTNPCVIERRRMSDGVPIRGYLLGVTPFEYMITEKDYEEALSESGDCGQNECVLNNIKMTRVLSC